MPSWKALMLVAVAGCETVGAGTVPGVAGRTPTPVTGLGELAGVRLPMSDGSNGATGPASESCFGADDQAVDCRAPGGRNGVRACTAQDWQRVEVRQLVDRPLLVDDPDLVAGAVIQGRRFAEGDFAPVAVPLADGPVPQPAPAAVAVRAAAVVQADAADELLFELGVDGRYGSAALAAALGLDRPRPANTVVLAVTDRFGTALFEPPAGDPAAVFRDGTMFTDTSGSMGPDNPPLYVASVSYGRQLLLAVRSAMPQADLRAALEGAIAGAPPTSEARPGLTFQAILASAELRASVRGTGLAVEPLRDAPPGRAYEALRQLLADRPPPDAGVPVAYTLKYLVDGQPAAMTFTARYQQIRCTPMPDRPFALMMTGSNIDNDLYVWLESTGGSELLLYSNERGGGAVNLNLVLDRHGASEGVIHMKVGNGDCFHASGNLAISVDGVTRWSLETDKMLSDCGWQLEGRVRVNQATGKLEELLRWVR